MSKQYEKLKGLLKELFQLDQPDLDFGLYRIMHAKSKEITQFLDKDLLPQVKAEFARHESGETAELKEKLDKRIKMRQELGDDPDQDAEVQRLRAEIAGSGTSPDQLESEVYDHLFGFFRRYYSDGDFLSKRVYKPGVYAIPYEGEEVKLHWANADQYYIKTSEYLRDYAFRLRADDDEKPMRVHFRLADVAEGEHGNVKAAEGKDRLFILAPDYDLDDPIAGAESATDDDSDDAPERHNFIEEEPGEQGTELVIRFEYRPATTKDWPESNRKGQKNPPTQKDLLEIAEARVAAFFVTEKQKLENRNWKDALAVVHTKANGERADYSRLRAHLNRYVARNTFDYFIHKDLGGFLSRELDFYIKNEVMHLDDITDETQTVPRVEQYLSKIKVIRRVAGKIIAFLAQLEDFQKKLWLKKKFVLSADFCVTLDLVPESLYAQIASSKQQRHEWVKHFRIDEIKENLNTVGYSVPLTVKFLSNNPGLPVDTSLLPTKVKEQLVDSIANIDQSVNSLAVHSENFSALSLIARRYQGHVSCIYMDPPYNTGSDGFTYRDSYQHSSWLTMIRERVNLARLVLASHGCLWSSIDDREARHLEFELRESFGHSSFVSNVAVINNFKGRQDRAHIATAHEHLMLTAMPDFESHGFPLTQEKIADYDLTDENDLSYTLRDLRKRGGADTREKRKDMYFPLFWNEERGKMSVERTGESDIEIVPTKSNGVDGCWRWGPAKVRKNIDIIEGKQVRQTGRWNASYRVYLENDGQLRTSKPKSFWIGTKYSSDRGIKTLRSFFPNVDFPSPKAVGLIQDIVTHSTCDDELILDFFAGSGTTGQSVIEANREDTSERKSILIEADDCFEGLLKPRLLKSSYSAEWKNGRPRFRGTQSFVLRYMKLESYEDALNNLQVKRTQQQTSLLEANDEMREHYTLRYMLDVETAGSPSLLNVASFIDPTAYKLKVKRPGSDETRETNVDLIETFNWLIGLTVHHLAAPQCFEAKFERDGEKRMKLKGRLKSKDDAPHWFRTATGTTPDGRKTLVIWRKRPGGEDPAGVEQDNLVLDEWFTKSGYSSKDSEFDLIYVNGTNNLENLRTATDTWKVRLIEEDFHRLMFEGTE